MREFADMVQAREPLVDNIIGFMDWISFPTECTSERVQQNAFYCGYNCDTMVNNVFAYCWETESARPSPLIPVKSNLSVISTSLPECFLVDLEVSSYSKIRFLLYL